MLKIITHPHPILRKKSLPVNDIFDSEIQKLIPKMTKTMLTKDGVGLAAPQIGKNLRLIIMRHQDDNLIMINPKITKKSWFKEWGEEGCLSVPGKYGEVKRHKKIKLEFNDEKNQKKIATFSGLSARIIQHEIDHLNGVLFIDHARKISDIIY